MVIAAAAGGGVLAFMAFNKPTAMEVCRKFADTSAASGCVRKTPAGLGADAKEAVSFDLPHGKTGQVLRFEDADDYKECKAGFAKHALLAGPYRWGNKSALLFVQLNSETDPAVAAKIKRILDKF